MSKDFVDHRRPGGTLYRYLVREMVFPSLYSLLGFTLVVLTKDVLGYIELVVNRGQSAGLLASILFFQTLPLATYMLPFAVMVGSMVALGRLGADRELLVLEASGVSSQRLVGPVFCFAGAMSAIAFALSLAGAPWASRSLEAAFDEVARSNPAATLRAGAVNEFAEWKLEARELSPDGAELRGVSLWMPELRETVFAESGRMSPGPNGDTHLELFNGSTIVSPRERLRQLRFDQLETDIPLRTQEVKRSLEDRFEAMTLDELGSFAADPEPGERNRRQALIEAHGRLALPMATALFGLLSLPLFLSRAQFSRSAGGMLGVAVTVAYYGLVQLATGLVQSETVPLALGVWLPNLFIAALAAFLFWRLPRATAFGRHLVRPEARAWRLRLRWPRRRLREPGEGEPAERRTAEGAAARRSLDHPKSRPLERYVAMRFLEISVAVFAVLLVAYLLVDILERLQWFAKYQASAFDAVRFYGARIPLLASRVLPMSLLVATALTVALLASQGELMAIRACGIPAGRALLPVLLLCGAIAAGSFVLNDAIVPRTNQIADTLKHTEIKGRSKNAPADPMLGRKPIWFRIGDTHYAADRLDPQLGYAGNISITKLGPDGLPTSRVDAVAARHFGRGQWRLFNAVRADITSEGPKHSPAPQIADLGEELPASVDTMHLSVAELRKEIDLLRDGGRDATVFEVDLFVKIAAPFACLVLPALALFFCVSGPPYPSSSVSLVVSAVVAVSYVLLTGLGASLGHGGAVSPSVAGWAPLAPFMILAAWLGLRLRGFGQSLF